VSTIKVSLADAPTDVLVYLVDNGPATISVIAAAVAPPEAVSPASIVSYAIDLLRRIGYVKGNDRYEWAATVDGINAVAEARKQVTA